MHCIQLEDGGVQCIVYSFRMRACSALYPGQGWGHGVHCIQLEDGQCIVSSLKMGACSALYPGLGWRHAVHCIQV